MNDLSSGFGSRSVPEGTMEVEVGLVSSFSEGARSLIRAGTRNIAVYNHKGKFYAIDNACYHHGGPLHNGDIEDLGGHPCVICPWHSYRIALDTGEGLYVGLDLMAKKECVKSKGVKQRVHPVIIRDGKVVVKVETGGPSIESDTYANMAIANQEQPSGRPTTQTHNLRNIHSKGPGASGLNTLGANDRESGSGKMLSEIRKGRLDQVVKTLSTSDVPHVQCIAKRFATADQSVAVFVFDRVSGFEPKDALRPGMWVTLELPVSLKEAQESMSFASSTSSQVVGGRVTTAPAANTFTVQSAMSSAVRHTASLHGDQPMPDTHLKRTYTVLNATSNGRNRHSQGWFTIAVKNMSSPTVPKAVRAKLHAGGCGSRWLHSRGHTGDPAGVGTITSPEVRVVDAGGKFSIGLERTLIAKRQGRVLLLTGGIGITPSFASISEMLQDDFARSSGPSLHMVHVHIDTTLAAVPFLPELLAYRQGMSSCSISTDPMSYNLKLYLTRQSALDNTKGELIYSQLPRASQALPASSQQGSSPNGLLTRSQPVEDPLLKGFNHKLMGSLRSDASLMDSTLAELCNHGGLVFGKRPTCSEVQSFCKQHLGTPSDYVVFLCGPQDMITEWTSSLVEAGVSSQSILCEQFDF